MTEGLQTALQAAAKLKEASLKDRPSRQAWERAPSFFKWTCGNYPHVIQARALADFAERLERAEEFKEEGNQLFVEDKLDDALIKYSNAVAVFVWFHRKDGRSVEDVELRSGVQDAPSAAARASVEQHLAACFLNAAAVLLKQRDLPGAIFSCTKSLEYVPASAKAYYRRAQAHIALDSTYDLELAVKDLQQACKLDPEDRTIARAYATQKAALAAQNKKDKSTFGNMFSRGSLYADSQPAASHPTDDALGWIKPPFSEDAKRQANELGIDLNDPLVRKQLETLHKERLAGTGDPDAGRSPHVAIAGQGGGAGHPEQQDDHPITFLEWWHRLISCRLKWRWHYIVYLALWGNALWRTYTIVFRPSDTDGAAEDNSNGRSTLSRFAQPEDSEL